MDLVCEMLRRSEIQSGNIRKASNKNSTPNLKNFSGLFRKKKN